MKALFFAILFILEISVVYSQAPWLLQSPLPTDQSLTRNYFLDANTGYVVGNNGTVIYTSNGGSLWEKRESGVTNGLLSVYFVSPTTGWCAGEGVIIKTTNGGINWQTQLSDPNLYVNSVYFINENKGWAAGRFGKLYSTENGGSNWILNSFDSTAFLTSIHFTDSMNGFIAGGQSDQRTLFLRTSNGGSTWIPETDFYGIIMSIDFDTPDSGWLVTHRGYIRYTSDGGNTWNIRTSVSANGYTYISFSTLLKGFVLAWDRLYTTTDGGLTWSIQYVQDLLSFNTPFSINYLDENSACMFGDGGIIFKTTNGGVNWNSQTNGPQSLFSTYFIDNKTGWAVGELGQILHTTDGGINWFKQISGMNDNFHSVYFTSINTGYIASVGRILKTSNSGLNWFVVYSDSTSVTASISFPNSSTGYAAGYDGKIIKTTNAGLTWLPLNSNVPHHFLCVDFISSEIGWVAGTGGIILHTTNGGINWTSQNPGTQVFVHSLFFLSDLVGYASDYEILKTTNGGENWYHTTPVPGSAGVLRIHFLNADLGYASCLNGLVYKTTNGGVNWSSGFIGLYYHLNSLFFTSPDTGWVVGSRGVIYKTTNGGTTTTIHSVSSNIPEKFFLHQNYPNPFNPTTRIKYELTTSEHITLKIYDVLGKQIAELVNTKQNAGAYEIEFDASNLPSGIYFYTLKTDNFSETRRMIVLK